MINEINKMLKTVADATTELENKITEYLGDNIEVDVDNIDYESFRIIMSNPETHRIAIFDYHVLMDSIKIDYYDYYDNISFIKNLTTINEVLEDIKEFLKKEEN